MSDSRLMRGDSSIGPVATTSIARAPAPVLHSEPQRGVIALETLVREHYGPLVAYATRLTGNDADASDLAHDVLECAIRRMDSQPPGANLRAWLFVILRNAFLDRCRRRRARGTSESVDDLQVPAAAPVEEAPAWTAITLEQLRGAIDRLDDDFRVVYRMHAIDGASYEEIAARLRIAPGTVGTRLLRARKKLRALLEGEVPELAGALDEEGERDEVAS